MTKATASAAVVEEVAGKGFRGFLSPLRCGTDEIPYDDFLAAAGLELTYETTQVSDLGFSSSISLRREGCVPSIEPGSEAEAAGLRDGDTILGPVGKTAPPDPLEWLRELPSGDSLELRIRRGKKEMQISFMVGTRQVRRFLIREIPHPSEKQRRIRAVCFAVRPTNAGTVSPRFC